LTIFNMMKSELSIALIICLTGSAFPVIAQGPRPSIGPIATAIAREAARFADASSQPGDAAWARVRELEPEAEVTVTVKGSPPRLQYFVAADESSLTVVNAAAPDISASVQMARDSVAEITVARSRIGKSIGWGAAIGGGAGFVAGLLAGTRRCRRQNCDNFPPLAFGLIFSMFGGGIGTGLGAVVGAARGTTHEVIYQAP
jgi:hypothetical protein